MRASSRDDESPQAVAENQLNKNRMSDLCPFDQFAERMSTDIRSGKQWNDEEFWRHALELFQLQFNAIEPLASVARSRGVEPQQLDDWTRIPALPAAMFKEFELTVLSPERRTNVFLSSGTTEQTRSRHFHCAESMRLYETSLRSWFDHNVSRPDFSFFSLTPSAEAAPNSSLAHMFECVGRDQGTRFLGCVDEEGNWEVDFDHTLDLLKSATSPILLMGTAFSFVHLLDHMKRERIEIRLPSESRVMETGGYKGRSRVVPKFELYRKIRVRLDVMEDDILCEYGMSELSSQAYDTGRGTNAENDEARLFRFPPWAHAKVISPETGSEVANGEIGLLRIFDLANVYSVMAIQTEDLAVRHGDEFELIGRMPQSEPRGCSLMTIDES